MTCHNHKGVLSIPIYSYIDNKQKINIDKIYISNNNNIDLHFSFEPYAGKPENISFTVVENGAKQHREPQHDEGYRENYNERYD